MTRRNPHFDRLKTGYLFPEVNARKKQFLAKHPDVKLISLGIGDTTEPLSPTVVQALVDISGKLGTHSGYIGYGAEQGIEPIPHPLRRRLLRLYPRSVSKVGRQIT